MRRDPLQWPRTFRQPRGNTVGEQQALQEHGARVNLDAGSGGVDVDLVSTVEGRLQQNVGLAEILHATFPGGSITGAPKLAAIDHIARFEPVGRGAAP